ncbi:complex proteins associated with Set1p component shg1-domain-containing protein [Mycotypha africana]|uniref:complex proteins associated with Set1p component shg1-domain-containing protein n=1 Tax=Mycotypha africana TaxID=64632 RepID=UPI0023009DA3|nr:complex proteins associated with Set1p component shg1-domain-containing protein [Mycotypha africana]KAI8967987.1 complex proteins associated with Set1p component shg1-domain-containing protein [Mycotypha africana]
MLPEDIVLQLKKNGFFDSLRKQLLTEFQMSDAGQQFSDKLNNFIENKIENDPSLLERNSSSFYEHISSEIEKSDTYTSLRDQILETLKRSDFQDKIDEEIRTVTEKAEADEQ